MPEVIIPILATNSSTKGTKEQKKERKGKARNRSKTFSDRKAGVPAPFRLQRFAGTLAGRRYRFPLLHLQAGYPVGCGAGPYYDQLCRSVGYGRV